MSLRAVDLTLSFGQRAILSGVSADVQPGAVTALIGPTGSGKTTLLRTLNRMNDKVAGTGTPVMCCWAAGVSGIRPWN